MSLELSIRAAKAFAEASSLGSTGPVYVAKAQDELEPFLALLPFIVGLPTTMRVTPRFLIASRPIPVHILGIVDKPVWADGRWCSPADFFYHDLDHARFKIREDLLALGYDCPDVDEERTILPHVLKYIEKAGPKLWELVPERLVLVRKLLSGIDGLGDADLANAAEWLLFEIVHEKSFPVDRAVLRREVRNAAHIAKLRGKCQADFYRETNPGEHVTRRLENARDWLIQQL